MCFFPSASTLHTANLYKTVLRASFAAQRRSPFFCKFIHAPQGVWINLCGRELHSVFQTPFSPPAKLRSNARFAVRKNVGERRTAKSINYVVTAHRRPLFSVHRFARYTKTAAAWKECQTAAAILFAGCYCLFCSKLVWRSAHFVGIVFVVIKLI